MIRYSTPHRVGVGAVFHSATNIKCLTAHNEFKNIFYPVRASILVEKRVKQKITTPLGVKYEIYEQIRCFRYSWLFKDIKSISR